MAQELSDQEKITNYETLMHIGLESGNPAA